MKHPEDWKRAARLSRWRTSAAGLALSALLLACGSVVFAADIPVAEPVSAKHMSDIALMWGFISAALATGIGALGAAYAVSHVGAAALGAMGERPEISGRALIFLGLAEGIAIYGLIISIMILGKLGMNAVQIIGDANTVLAFALGGVSGHVVQSAEEARAAVQAVVDAVRHAGGPVQCPTLLLVTSATAERIRGYLDAVVLDASGPLILEFPGFSDPQSTGPVERFVGRILGVHL